MSPSQHDKTSFQLESLPVELKTRIMQYAPDVRSMFSLIAAAPSMVAVYRHSRERIFTSVVRNEISESLIQHATFLLTEPDTQSLSEPFLSNVKDISVVDAKILLRQERLTRRVIQICINDELEAKTDVLLTEIEWLRLRRGLYNLRVAAKSIEEADPDDELGVVRIFYQQRTTSEILEMLFIVYCLRNRFSNHFHSLDDALLNKMLHHEYKADFEEEEGLFCEIVGPERYIHNLNRPWESDIETLYRYCQAPAFLHDKWNSQKQEFNYLEEEFEPLTLLNSFIPINHVLDGQGDGFRWLNEANATGHCHDYHHSIPLGFMIWDNKRLQDMKWMCEQPPLQPIEEKWRTSYRGYRSVEERFDAAVSASVEKGDKLNLNVRYDSLVRKIRKEARVLLEPARQLS